ERSERGAGTSQPPEGRYPRREARRLAALSGVAAGTLPRDRSLTLPRGDVAVRDNGAIADFVGCPEEASPARPRPAAGGLGEEVSPGGANTMTNDPEHLDADELAGRWLDEGTPPAEMDEAGRRRLAELQLLHGLLVHLHDRDAGARERRVQRVIQALKEPVD